MKAMKAVGFKEIKAHRLRFGCVVGLFLFCPSVVVATLYVALLCLVAFVSLNVIKPEKLVQRETMSENVTDHFLLKTARA